MVEALEREREREREKGERERNGFCTGLLKRKTQEREMGFALVSLKEKHKPLKYCEHRELLFTLLKTRHFWDQKGEIFTKVNNFDKSGALAKFS